MKKIFQIPVFLFFLSLSLCICLFASCTKEIKKKQDGKKIYKVTLIRDGKALDARVVR
ncbi:MAG: hypothetical protein M9898_02305 [Chitinophagaceae bacterium]|nr:hypothetical protein [Chitinophagaceae bacterium]